MRRLVLVSADRRKQKRLKGLLEDLHPATETADSSAQVWRALLDGEVEAIVVDATRPTPELEPWRLIAELRAASDLPLLVVTRSASRRDRMRAFAAGATQCLSEPVFHEELRVSLTAIFGGKGTAIGGMKRAGVTLYVDPTLQIDFRNCQIVRPGQTIPLTGREVALLKRLVQDTGKLVRFEELLGGLWGRGALKKRQALLKAYIRRLRQKMEPDPKKPCYIISRRGQGYIFLPQPVPSLDESRATPPSRHELNEVTVDQGPEATG